ncbi:hypothetical protein CYJ23_08245 [Actinomyces oris]|nr:hypothetical protein CYJ23_08245 [Actinomyces oris]
MSMVLTSTPLQHRAPRRNRGIATFLKEVFAVGLVSVSTVDTGPPVSRRRRCRTGARWRWPRGRRTA